MQAIRRSNALPDALTSARSRVLGRARLCDSARRRAARELPRCRRGDLAIDRRRSARPIHVVRRRQDATIWLPIIHHPALDANRRSLRIRKAFAQLWGRNDIWMSVDKGGFNPPETERWKFPGPHLHWDVSLAPPVPFGMQGILYLTDTAADQGAFRCVPGFHRKLNDWLRSLPPEANPREQNLESLGAVPSRGVAGDLIIWRQELPHGSSPNRTAKPRIVQYISGEPSEWEINPVWVRANAACSGIRRCWHR